jgi:signal transduction histidine kinase
MPKASSRSRVFPSLARGALVVALALAVLLWAEREDYLLFHSLAELFSIIIATSAFVIAWNSRRLRRDSYLTFLGTGLLAVAAVDLVHALAYKGMGVFPGLGTDTATQLWVAGRYLEAGMLLALPAFIGRRVGSGILLAAFSLAVLLIFVSIFAWENFPTCFVSGQGLTPFKLISEYVICGLILVAMALLWRRRKALDGYVVGLMLAAMGTTVVQELAFTLYADPYGFWNFTGHCLKILAFFLLYKAIVETGFSRPVELLFRDLKEGRRHLEELNETLEARVAARTVEAEQRATEVRRLAMELSRTEERERRRLALVLHDHLQQLLVAAKMRCELVAAGTSAGERSRDLEQIEEILAESIEATRSLTAELSPPIIHQVGLVSALEWLRRETGKIHDLVVELQADPAVEPLMGEDMKLFLFRATRELLFNTVKHAGVKTAKVELIWDGGDELVLEVADEGRGFAPTGTPGRPTGGFGLSSIRERASLLGGGLEIEAAPGAGTRMRLRVPLAAQARPTV